MNGHCPFKWEINKMFYTKSSDGKFIPVEFTQVISKDWSGKLIIVRLGTDERPATEDELIEVNDNLDNASVIEMIPDTSFLITSYAMQFDVLGNLDDLGKQYIVVKVMGNDDLSKLGGLQKDAKEKLKYKAKKVAVLPTPLTVDEYHEVMEIKQRCDLRRLRRGH
jgi:hypothetical protein